MKSDKHGQVMTIYYHDGSHQVVHPTRQFDGNWRELAKTVSQGNHQETYKKITVQ